MPEEQADGERTARGLMAGLGRAVGDRVRRELDAARAEGEADTPAAAAAAVLRGLAGDAGQSIGDRVRQGIDTGADRVPKAAGALGGLVTGVGHDLSDLVRQEIGAARSEVAETARAGARGAGLLGAAAATGNTAVLFAGVALWRGLGNRIGYARSALVVAGVSGAATAVLAKQGMTELARVQRSRRTARRDAVATARRVRRRPPGRPDADAGASPEPPRGPVQP